LDRDDKKMVKRIDGGKRNLKWRSIEFVSSLLNQELVAPVSIGLQADLMLENEPKTAENSKITAKTIQTAWPNTLPAQVSATALLLASASAALSLADIEASFKGKGPWKKGLPRILETLEALGRARREEGGGWRGL
jgi:hypothetical protein